MVVIADANGVESIAGIMGGEHSGCDVTTRDVLIESALWDPTNIAHTGRKLGVMTDARYRFERGVDPDFCVPGCDLATEFVLSISAAASLRAWSWRATHRRRGVRLLSRTARSSDCIGVDIPREEGEAILAADSASASRTEGYLCLRGVPTCR